MSDERVFTPREIVSELDRYVIGQRDAKRAVAIALRNRWRRQQVASELRDEIAPKNIIMIGATGVGKTEIARRLAKLAQAPFIKVEASKFTEVGYVGRDVESIIRDLTELAIKMVGQEEQVGVRAQAEERAEERLIDALLPSPVPVAGPADPETGARPRETREKLRRLLRLGELDEREVELELADAPGGVPSLSVAGPGGAEEIGAQWRELLAGMLPKKTRRRRLKVAAAREALIQEEAEALVDPDRVRERAVRRVEQSGIVFIDEIDKVAVAGGGRQGPDVSREGVQRDLLPIVEGSTVQTKHGPVETDHILFVAAGAFHVAKPSDLMPELQGRFPIRVELASLGREELVRILTEPTNSLVRQYTALLATEGIALDFEPSGIEAIAEIAATVNERHADIGARRLHTVMERLLEDLSFEAPDLPGQRVTVDRALVQARLGELLDDQDLSQFIL
ncbi:MAG: ATP-dependent protease ATPase subunit HslU [Myxococcota bacterium]